MKRRFRNERGFTLMETLLAMTLFAIVIASSYSIFFMGVQIWKRTVGPGRAERKVFFALEKMSSDIRQARPLPPEAPQQSAEKIKEFEYQGGPESFSLPSVLPVEDRQGNVFFEPGTAGYAWDRSHHRLCRMTRNATQLFQDKEAVCSPVLEGVEKASFQYWLANPITKTYSWYDSWERKDGLPQAVRATFEVTFKDRDKKTVRNFQKTFWIFTANPPVEDAPPGAA